MMKKAMAIMLAAVMLLQPVMASAVTWGAVVGTINTLRDSGVEFEYVVEDDVTSETKVTLKNDTIEINGGTVTEVAIDDSTAGNYTFINVVVDGQEFVIHVDTGSASVSFTEGTEVAVNTVTAEAVAEGGSATLTVGENAKLDVSGNVWVNGYDGGKGTLVNAGDITVANEIFADSNGEGSAVTLTNNEGATIDVEVALGVIAKNGAEGTFTNAGTINGGDVNVFAQANGEVTAENSGTITSNIGVQATTYDEESGEYVEGATSTVDFTNSGTINAVERFDEEGNAYSQAMYITTTGNATVNVTNATVETEEGETITGSIEGDVWIVGGTGNWEEDRELNAPEDAEYSLTFTNEGTVNGSVNGSTWENGTTTTTNSGEISGSLATDAHENTESSLNNSGTAANLYANANGSGAANVTNEGTVSGETWFDAMGDSSVTISNTGTFENGIGSGADEGASLTVENSGTVNGKIYSEGWGEANVTVSNTSDGTVDSIWVNGMGSSEVSATNDGTVNGEIGGGVYESGSTVNIENNSTADSAWVTAMGGGTVNMENNGAVTNGMGVSTDGASTLNTAGGTESVAVNEIYIETGSNEVLSEEKVAQITANLNLSAGAVMYTVNAEGEIDAAFEVDENGNVTLVGAAEEKKEEPVDNSPSPEMIRHWMEELRKKQAIGGVYGSPYWLKQLYLGYHNLELRLYENGERELFKEMLSWYEGGPQKRLTLRVNVENPQDLTMRLDGEVIDILERCEFAVITLQDKNKNVIMEYNVADLKAARSLYGLARTDLLCVADADAEVMKIGADGKMVPVEEKAAE